MIELYQIEKSFGKRKVFDSLTYTFQTGRFYLIYGKNGAGKSTLFSLLSLFDRQYRGIYLLEGENRKYLWGRKEEKKRRECFSLLSPTNDLPPHLTLGELSALEGFDCCFSFSPDKNIDTLSGGEKEMIALQIEFHKQKPYLLLDETTSQLDDSHMEEFLNLLQRRPKEQTVLFFTHDIRLKGREKTLLLEEGKIKEI